METLQPKLRFPGFEGDWESKTLGEIFSIFNGYAFSSSDSIEEGVLWVKIADVGIQQMKKDNLSFLPNEYIDKHKKFILKKDDYVIALTRPILNGKLKIAKIDDFFNGSLLNQRVGKLITSNNSTFVFNILQKDILIKSIENNISGSDPPNLSPNEISYIETYIPSLQEQTRIANFLSAVDEKLNLLKEKKSLLEEYKKGIMQKIFNQELRFKDDNGEDFEEWEEKQIKDIFKVTRGTVLSMLLVKDNIEDDFIHPVYSSQTKQKGLAGFYNNYLFENAITWTTDGAGAGDVKYREGKFYCTNVCGVLLNEDGYCNLFIAEMINSISRKYVSYVGNPKLMNNVMAEIMIYIPSSIKEQTKIANFLSAIDEKIELVSTQIEETQEYKKGLLQQMFV